MLTLHKNKNTRVLCQIISGRKKIDLNYHPTEEVKFMNAVEDLQTFNTQHFRDNFELSKAQAELIFNALNNDDDIEEERLQAKFFKVKRYIKEMLMTSMDLSDTKSRFQIDFEPNLEFSGHILLASSTMAGKTYWLVQMLVRALKAPKERRRQIIYLSAEWDRDVSLQPLKDEKFREWVTGIGIGDHDIPDNQTKEEYFASIKTQIDTSPKGTIICADDAQDSFAPHAFRHMFDKMLRCARHDCKTLCLIFHSIKSGVFTSQSMNSVRYLVIFPRSQKQKIVSFLNKDLQIPAQKTRDLVKKFSQTGRSLVLRMHSPECLIGEQYITLL